MEAAGSGFCWQNVRPGTTKICPILAGSGSAPRTYAAVESYDLADGSRQLTRDPGDALWAEVFDLLPGAQESTALKVLSADRKGDCLEVTLGAAAALLDVDPRQGGPAGVPGVAPVPALRAAPAGRSGADVRRAASLGAPGKSQLGAAGGWRGRRIARSAGASSLAAGGTRPGREPRARCSATPATRSSAIFARRLLRPARR